MTAETTTVPTTSDSEAPYPRRWAAMIVLILAFMLDLVNVTIVNVGLPAIQRDFGASPTQLEWISAAYLLAFAAALITFARLGDLWGRKRVFLAGVAAFAAAGVWSGIAQGPTELIAARAVQGVAAAALAPQVMSSLYGMFHGRERATVFGVFGIVAGLAQAGGLVLGGVLITADIAGLGWRTIFLVTVPAAVVLVAAGAWLVPESRVAGGSRPRWLATGVLTAALVAIVFTLLEGRTYGWPAWIWLGLAAGIAAVVGLALAEHRRPERRAGALLPLDLLRRPVVASGLAVQLLAFAAFSGFLLVFVLWLQDGQGYSALDAGMAAIGFSAGGLAMAPFTGRLIVRFGRLVTLAGCLLSGAGALGVLAAAHAAPQSVGAWTLIPGLFVMGAGMNLVMPSLSTLFLNGVPSEHAGSASGIWNTSQQFGAALGVAGVGTVFFAGLDAGGHAMAFTASMLAVVAALLVSAALCLTLPARTGPQDA
ncbi:MFS transporter [Murinocardiopsis flavida]|uniref:MFS transporter n=1 Tax=Murinocardiopsis flavida TaxID=645275 RepID=A0A2P8D3K9_9ACTN|nr:MFS transporter [Murinocardiopsis flavida]PSK91769.1 MFS transporter [Murinocardiopsis flavida]